MCVVDLLLLALCPVIFSNPGVSGVCIHPKVTSGLRNRLLGFDREFHCALFEFGRIAVHCGFTHRTHLSRFTIALVSVCPVEYSHISMNVAPLKRNDTWFKYCWTWNVSTFV